MSDTNPTPAGMVPIGPNGDQAQDLGPGTELQEWNREALDAIPGLRESFMAMLDLIPETGPDATASILAQILNSAELGDLDRPWDAEGMREYVDTVLRVVEIKQMPSDYTSGLGVYLVCTCEQPEVGERFILTTGSASIVVQLGVAHVKGWLPLQVIPRKSAKPSRNGFFPMHLDLVRQTGRRRAVVIDQPAQGPTRQEQHRATRAQRILDEARAAGPSAGEGGQGR